MGPLLRRLLNLEDTMESGLKMTTKLFLVFVAICATATATAIPTTNANGTSLSTFLTDFKHGLENLLGMVQRFEMEQSTQIDQTTSESTMANDQSIPRILVVTGEGWVQEKTEVWPKPESQCNLPDFPLKVGGAVAFWTAQGPMVCGGFNGENKCFLYKNHQWMPSTNMRTQRRYASAVQINLNQAINIGGVDDDDINSNDLKTTEVITSTGSEGKVFPVTIRGHCSFKINSTHALVTGGDQDGSISASTWFVDLTTTTVTPGPKMTSARRGLACSTFNLGRKTFGVVAGGYYPKYLDSTEWIDLEEDSPTWTEGPKLPRGLSGLNMVETPQGTYALGGLDEEDNRRSEVLKLDCPGTQIQSCQWQEMPEKLEVGRKDHVSLSLPKSYDICN